MIGAVIIGAFGSVTVVAPQTAVQRSTDNGSLGRVSAVFLAVEAAATLVGAIVGPLVAESVSLHFAAMGAAVVAAVGALVGAVTVPRVMLPAKRSNEQADSHA
jgi:MFS family permease